MMHGKGHIRCKVRCFSNERAEDDRTKTHMSFPRFVPNHILHKYGGCYKLEQSIPHWAWRFH